jgi:thiol-disulfide isomerase/thioredoxin
VMLYRCVFRFAHRAYAAIVVVLAASLLGLMACGPADSPRGRATDTVVVESRRVGQRLPALTVPTFSGDSATIGGAAHQAVTLVNLWATYCGPCIAEFPALEALRERYEQRGLRVLAVSVDRGDAEVKAFLMGHPVNFRVGRDPTERVSAALANTALPQTVLVSTDGRVLYRSEGFGKELPAALFAAIDAALGSR